MKFAIVSDVHIGKYQKFKFIYRKNTLYSKKYLRRFVRKMNRVYKPDFVINLGDLVEDIDQRHDVKNYTAGLKIFSRLKCPIYHVVGNHDQRNLSDDFLRQAIGHSELFYKVDRADCRLIFLFTEQDFRPDGRLHEPYLNDTQLQWLAHAAETSKPIIIFSHASLVPVDTTGNFWFKDDAASTYIKNQQQFLKIIRGKNIQLAFNGHLHWNKLVKLNNVNYITIQSLVENTSGRVKGAPANAYALVHVDQNKVAVDIKGWGGVSYRILEEAKL